MMKKPDAMMNDGTMMKKPDATMMKGGTMIRQGTMMGMSSRGEEVRAAQSFLKREGFYTGSIDGIFGSEMRSAVIKFQNSKKITPTGIIGPTTRAAMRF